MDMLTTDSIIVQGAIVEAEVLDSVKEYKCKCGHIQHVANGITLNEILTVVAKTLHCPKCGEVLS